MKIFGGHLLIISAALFIPYAISASAQSKSLPATKNSTEAAHFASIEQAVMVEINAARRDPQKFVKYLEDYRKQFQGNTVFLPSLSQVETNEGTTAVDDAIAFLKQISNLSPYQFSEGLNQAARMQLNDLMENDKLSHRGKNGSDLSDRMNKFGSFGGRNAENISYYAQDPRQIVLMMIVDDGVKNRSHRKNIFSKELKVVGIAFGKGKVGQGLCVIDFADSFSDTKYKGAREF